MSTKQRLRAKYIFADTYPGLYSAAMEILRREGVWYGTEDKPIHLRLDNITGVEVDYVHEAGTAYVIDVILSPYIEQFEPDDTERKHLLHKGVIGSISLRDVLERKFNAWKPGF